jgi:hypothetical protein
MSNYSAPTDNCIADCGFLDAQGVCDLLAADGISELKG